MDLLPKHMCYTCTFKLDQFHEFYENCLRTDANLKSQLSWMQGRSINRDEMTIPMVHISNIKIKNEPLDYDDGGSTEELYSCGITNFIEKPYAHFRDPISSSKCSLCGCYCGNRNMLKKTSAKSCTRTKHNDLNDTDYDRNSIRRNLFATEIFGDKNTRIQTEIPVWNITRDMLSHANPKNKAGCIVKLNRFNDEKSFEDTRKIEMSVRSLRSRKTCITSLTNRPKSKQTKVSNQTQNKNKTSSAKKQNIPDETQQDFKAVEIKSEASEEWERSLRPRMESINYSETRRKNSLLMPTEKSINKKQNNSASLTEKRGGRRRLEPDVKVKVEPMEICEFAKPKVPSATKNLKSTGKKALARQKNIKKDRYTSQLYLRSQRGHLRNGKLKNFDKPNPGHPKSITQRSIEMTKSSDSLSEKTTDGRYRDCDSCNSRFASAELYMLHGCYANRRH